MFNVLELNATFDNISIQSRLSFDLIKVHHEHTVTVNAASKYLRYTGILHAVVFKNVLNVQY